MLFIAAFALYAIVVQRVSITRGFVLTGRNARNFGITLLILLVPLMLAIEAVLRAVLPETVFYHPILRFVIPIFVFGVITLLLAQRFRDPEPG